MFIIVTVYAQKFPIAAVGRIIVVVVISVMDCQFAKFFALELASAPRAYPGENLECPFSVTAFSFLAFASRFRRHACQFFFV
jgi:hypothetical protein